MMTSAKQIQMIESKQMQMSESKQMQMSESKQPSMPGKCLLECVCRRRRYCGGHHALAFVVVA
jgi:hypothetical protein